MRGDRLLDLVIAKIESIDLDGDPLDGPDLNTKEAGEKLRMSAKTVERRCREGKIEAHKTSDGGQWRISLAALREYRQGRSRPRLKLED
ncbi:MAG: helix-turn-helix domain-containing protein [Planctomycetota bacterium]